MEKTVPMKTDMNHKTLSNVLPDLSKTYANPCMVVMLANSWMVELIALKDFLVCLCSIFSEFASLRGLPHRTSYTVNCCNTRYFCFWMTTERGLTSALRFGLFQSDLVHNRIRWHRQGCICHVIMNYLTEPNWITQQKPPSQVITVN